MTPRETKAAASADGNSRASPTPCSEADDTIAMLGMKMKAKHAPMMLIALALAAAIAGVKVSDFAPGAAQRTEVQMEKDKQAAARSDSLEAQVEKNTVTLAKNTVTLAKIESTLGHVLKRLDADDAERTKSSDSLAKIEKVLTKLVE